VCVKIIPYVKNFAIGGGLVENNPKDRKIGLIIEVIGNVIMGSLVLYWRMVRDVPQNELLAMRIIMCCLTAGIVAVILGKWKEAVAYFKNIKTYLFMLLGGVCIVSSWGAYIWAVQNNYLIENGIGFFIVPIGTACCGMIFFKEKADKYIISALVVAAIGILAMTILYGRFPVLAVFVAIVNPIFFSVRRKVSPNPFVGQFVELSGLVPFMIAFLIWQSVSSGQLGFLQQPQGIVVLVLLIGVINTVPMIFIFTGQRKIDMISFALIGYLTPIVQGSITVLVIGEKLMPGHICALVCAAIALLIYSIGLVKKSKAAEQALTAGEKQAVPVSDLPDSGE